MKKLFNSPSSILSLTGMILLFSLAWAQGVESTKAVAYPIFLLAGGVAAARMYQTIKGKPDDPT